MKPRGEVERFAQVMEAQLSANDHKGGWTAEDVDWLMVRLRQEVRELADALSDGASPAVVAMEAADVANFAMMIADVAGGLRKEATPNT